MVSFRYHVTSLAAALLALAVGIVVGTTSLSAEPVRTSAAPATSAPDTGSVEDLAGRVGSHLIRGALPGERVLLLLAPDAPADATRSVVAALRSAGATVTSQVHLLPTLLDASGTQTVDGVVTGTVPTGMALPAGSLLRAATLLASSMVSSEQGTDVTGLAQQKVLGGFTGGSLLSFDGALPTARATLVLLLAGPSRGPALATVASGFESRVGTVVVGTPASAAGRGVVAVLRRGSTGVSDVDGLGSAAAVLATVLALDEQASGRGGHYGVGPKADGIVPDLG
ncbi:MAG: channel-forming protein [Frankiales bacterium]|nr:channel-forming protein [Frankiales bacterium]